MDICGTKCIPQKYLMTDHGLEAVQILYVHSSPTSSRAENETMLNQPMNDCALQKLDYIKALESEKAELAKYSGAFECCKMVKHQLSQSMANAKKTTNANSMTTSEMLILPTFLDPSYRFISRLLADDGRILKEIESDSGCQIKICGQQVPFSSAADSDDVTKNAYVTPDDKLHLCLEATGNGEAAKQKITTAITMLNYMASSIYN
ncbi:unnamed protein product [Soboliphyme baturini]|uniref:KH domain-containing protein n=1 Tax=Soboliphyme baturini TaxID=241478 RepID=A0A183IPV6_9BILA|nr:unnamed protein product [Soboliphyme baturini]